MKHIISSRILRVSFIVMLTVLVLTGCSSEGPVSEEMKQDLAPVVLIEDIEQSNGDKIWPDSRLEYLLAVYWTARFNGDTRFIWEMEAPHFREMFDFQSYESIMFGVRINELIKIRVHGIEQKSDQLASIMLEFLIKTPDGRKRSFYLNDHWLRLGRSWYHVERDGFLFPT